MPSLVVNDATRREWRELGFYYTRDDDEMEWRIVGSRAGLLKFASVLNDYANNPKKAQCAEHDHYGPYCYLKLGTLKEPEITDNWIAGPIAKTKSLSETVGTRLAIAEQGDTISIRDAFAPSALYDIVLEVRDDAFDPASADPQLPPE